MAIKKLLQSSAVLLVLNLAGGAMHYLFQVSAASRLSLADLGNLNVGLAFFMFSMTSGLLVQYWANFRIPSQDDRMRMNLISLMVLSICGCYLYAAVREAVPTSLGLAFGFAVPAMIMTHYWLGVFQGRKYFVQYGIGMFLVGAFKYGGSFFAETIEGFALSVTLGGVAAGSVVMTLDVFNRGKPEPAVEIKVSKKLSDRRDDLFLTFFTGMGFVLFPSFDLLTIKYLLGTHAAGLFSQISLFSKALYFAPAVLLQVTLPYHVRIFRGKSTAAERKSIHRLEIFGLAACYFGSVVAAAIGPYLMSRFLGINGLHSLDIFLACASIVPLYGLMSSLQVSAAAKKVKQSASYVFIVLLSPVGAGVLGLETIRQYLIYATVMNTLFGLFGYLRTERRHD